MAPTLASAAIEAIARGLHPDPFAVLGPHDVEGGVVIRVFRPHVRSVEVIPFGQPDGLVLTRIHPEGLFEGVVPNERRDDFDYRLHLVWSDGSSSETDDAYRYGPVLTDFDLHLLGEG
ncbi:MAG: 1,4-alpha-glucan branching enzyme, partial [Acidobacteriota bacterium]|nr:1,4-alpha-glucan branching enzyme [Acidobacteriota bacterium]